MRTIVARPIIVGENEAFKQDLFGREDFGKSLLDLVFISSDELVISLDGKWGEGKTTFIKMWQGLLDKEDILNIYVNAFENDYSDDAFIAIAGAIIAYIEKNKENEGNSDEFIGRVKNVIVELLSLATKVGINVSTSGALNYSDIQKVIAVAKERTTENNIFGEKLASHKKNADDIQSFKNLLSGIPSLLNIKEGNPLVIIVDELDRCKPTYAIDFIEKVKHLFSVENVVFVLVMHKEQLEESVKSVYGQNIDAHTYLQKFISIEVSLPKKTGERHTADIEKYNNHLYNSYAVKVWGSRIFYSLEKLAPHFNLSFRQLEKVYTTLAVVKDFSGISEKVVPIAAFLAVIKVICPSLYQKLLHQKITYEELCTKTGLSEELTDNDMTSILKGLKFYLITDDQFEQLDQNDSVKLYGDCFDLSKRKSIIPTLAKRLSML